MTRITQLPCVSPLDFGKTSTEASFATYAGETFFAADGRRFILGSTGASAITAGKLVQSAALIANHQNLTVTAYTAPNTSTGTPAQVTVTLGATAVTANQYKFIAINDGVGAGQVLEVASHQAASASASLTLNLADTPVTALTTASKVCLTPNPYTDVVVAPTTLTNSVVGATAFDVAAATYTLFQTYGLSAMLADGALVIGSPVSASGSVAGALVQTPYAANLVTKGIVGRAAAAGVDTKYYQVFLTI